MKDVTGAINFVAWLAAAAVLLPGVWRRLFGKPRYLDDMWTVAFFIVVARQAFQWAVASSDEAMMAWSETALIVVAIAYIAVVIGYQRNDR